MDILIYTSMQECRELFHEAGFQTKVKAGYEDAVCTTLLGRYHIHYMALPTSVYVDLHYDLHIHFLFLGVFYKFWVEDFFRAVMQPLLIRRGVAYSVHASSWFRRRNKAILWGVKL